MSKHIDNYNFALPPELIAQFPENTRDESRLFVYNRHTDQSKHIKFKNILDLFPDRSLLVFNDTKVIPAKIEGIRLSTNKKYDLFFYKKVSNNEYDVLAKGIRSFTDNDKIKIGENPSIILTVKNKKDKLCVSFDSIDLLSKVLVKYGQPPLPPYIKRNGSINTEYDRIRYQTIYAKTEGSVAAPTAGLHFSEELLDKINRSKNIQTASITLNIGLATFNPVRVENIDDHKMDGEEVRLSADNSKKINDAINQGIPVIAVGTTTLKSLEGIYDKLRMIKPFKGHLDLFIRPPFKFNIVDHLITNFHLPRSTLFMLISAFTGIDKAKECYRIAIKKKYRFFSYGDAMFII